MLFKRVALFAFFVQVLMNDEQDDSDDDEACSQYSGEIEHVALAQTFCHEYDTHENAEARRQKTNAFLGVQKGSSTHILCVYFPHLALASPSATDRVAMINRAIGAQPFVASPASSDGYLIVMNETTHEFDFLGVLCINPPRRRRARR
jgi:hypothetical protein